MVKLIFKAYKKLIIYLFTFFLFVKMLTGYYKKKNKEKLSKKARERYQNLSEEEKDKRHQYACEQYRNLSEKEEEKKCQYGREQYKNLLENDKQKLVEYVNLF